MSQGAALAADDDFLGRFNGGFTGILQWQQLDRLWAQLRDYADDRWYVYAVGEEPPEDPVRAAEFDRFLSEIDDLLRRDHAYDYCGVVYVDRKDNPSLIKIFDPNNLGSSCGSSGMRVLPGWVLSRMRPLDLQAAMPPTRSRRRWWQDLFNTNRDRNPGTPSLA